MSGNIQIISNTVIFLCRDTAPSVYSKKGTIKNRHKSCRFFVSDATEGVFFTVFFCRAFPKCFAGVQTAPMQCRNFRCSGEYRREVLPATSECRNQSRRWPCTPGCTAGQRPCQTSRKAAPTREGDAAAAGQAAVFTQRMTKAVCAGQCLLEFRAGQDQHKFIAAITECLRSKLFHGFYR